ncbi:FixH family protein [Massilia horti]|uniref:Cytochrome oxidase assembly protein n=1 Tax=Massilia horti TaxID=2562153 RepID=A0A4Y9SPN7_9BURK|nr:FixH family protein [Massilia horti]TFW28445.1 cytochrome oxidase assembly protein [Massilia horti]
MKPPANTLDRQQAPWYAHRWPWFLMFGPAVVIAGGAFATWLAVRTPDELVVGDYYKQGKAINQDLRRDRVASMLRLSLRAHYDPVTGRLAGQITSAGKEVSSPFRILLAHPTLPRKDRSVLAQPGPDGRFSVDLPLLEHAHWQVVAEGALRDWRLERSWDWPRGGALMMDADSE